jgi:hypothetical protein
MYINFRSDNNFYQLIVIYKLKKNILENNFILDFKILINLQIIKKTLNKNKKYFKKKNDS